MALESWLWHLSPIANVHTSAGLATYFQFVKVRGRCHHVHPSIFFVSRWTFASHSIAIIQCISSTCTRLSRLDYPRANDYLSLTDWIHWIRFSFQIGVTYFAHLLKMPCVSGVFIHCSCAACYGKEDGRYWDFLHFDFPSHETLSNFWERTPLFEL